MKITRFLCVALALTPLSVGVGTLITSTPALSAPTLPNDGLPPGAPPLTSAQKQQQKQRIIKYQQDMQALQTNKALSNTQKQQQAQSLAKAFQQDMLKILTPQQRALVDAQNNKVIGLRQAFLKQHQAEINKEQKLAQSLQASITPAEKATMAKDQQSALQQIQALKSNSKLTLQEKQNMAKAFYRSAAHDALQVLTPKQQAQFKEIQALQTKIQDELAAFAKAHHTQ